MRFFQVPEMGSIGEPIPETPEIKTLRKIVEGEVSNAFDFTFELINESMKGDENGAEKET